MLKKIYVICIKHDENLLCLYQEAINAGYECIPVYLNNMNQLLFNDFTQKLTHEDYIIILHINFGSERLHEFIQLLKYKKCLNSVAFKQSLIGNKLYQQNKVAEYDSSITIQTYLKENFYHNLPLPLIVKPVDASCGAGVKMIKDYQELLSIPNNYIVQHYIPNDGDWRVVVVNNKAISAIKRVGKVGQATNNIATGNFAIAEKNPVILEKIFYIAEIASKSMGFDYVGVDVIKDIHNDQYFFLETNERPTFETSQILTGTNIAKKIIEALT
jgi:glutathione synthase/RimK-type ligase-like ATP-grasp enzyme